MDVIPYAIVKPGVHILTLESKNPPSKQPITVSASFEDAKRYRFAVQEGNVVVVEDVD